MTIAETADTAFDATSLPACGRGGCNHRGDKGDDEVALAARVVEPEVVGAESDELSEGDRAPVAAVVAFVVGVVDVVAGTAPSSRAPAASAVAAACPSSPAPTPPKPGGIISTSLSMPMATLCAKYTTS